MAETIFEDIHLVCRNAHSIALKAKMVDELMSILEESQPGWVDDPAPWHSGRAVEALARARDAKTLMNSEPQDSVARELWYQDLLQVIR